MDKLKWTSPFNSHRSSLSHLSHSSRSPCEHDVQPQPADPTHNPSQLSKSPWAVDASTSSLGSPSTAAEPHQAQLDGGHSSGSGASETGSPGWPLKRVLDIESMVWATAVALAWLEHSSASYFIEWEMVAAKASMWLSAQDIPEGRDLASVKAAANQLFIILRHWDENLQLNMLCYNPNSVWSLQDFGRNASPTKYWIPYDTMLTKAVLFSVQQYILWSLIMPCCCEQCVFPSVFVPSL